MFQGFSRGALKLSKRPVETTVLVLTERDSEGETAASCPALTAFIIFSSLLPVCYVLIAHCHFIPANAASSPQHSHPRLWSQCPALVCLDKQLVQNESATCTRDLFLRQAASIYHSQLCAPHGEADICLGVERTRVSWPKMLYHSPVSRLSSLCGLKEPSLKGFNCSANMLPGRRNNSLLMH